MRFARWWPMWAVLALSGCAESGPTTPGPGPDPDLVCTIPTEHIFSTGVGRNGIPALEMPALDDPGQIPFGLLPTDRVLGVVRHGAARAYPLPILWWHEVVNDTVGGEPVLVTYCPLTASGIVFDPRVDGGEPRRFLVSGALYRSNLTMVDRETESLWNQMLLGSQCGVDRGRGLERIPVVETTLEHFLARYPEATVVTTATGHRRNYGEYPYGDYDALDNHEVRWLPFKARWNQSRPPKELALGVFHGWRSDRGCQSQDGCSAKVWPFEALAARGDATVLNDSVGTRPVVVTFVRDQRMASAFDRTVDGQRLTFSLTSATPFRMRDAETGTVWNEWGVGVEGTLVDRQLNRIEDSYIAFWFAWSLYFPAMAIATG